MYFFGAVAGAGAGGAVAGGIDETPARQMPSSFQWAARGAFRRLQPPPSLLPASPLDAVHSTGFSALRVTRRPNSYIHQFIRRKRQLTILRRLSRARWTRQ